MRDGVDRSGIVLSRRLIAALMLLASPAAAHDRWADGNAVPAWVKRHCCGVEDVHHLRPDQVVTTANGYLVDGVRTKIPFEQALPSEDGDYWVFYRNYPDGTQSIVYCFFVPTGT